MLMRMRQSIELDEAFKPRRKGITLKLDELMEEIRSVPVLDTREGR
jgi:hypothetical protein